MTPRKSLVPLLCLAALLAACGGAPQESAQPSALAPASSTVSTNGRLKVCGAHVCNASGQQVQLKGMSWFWSNTGWGAERFFNSGAVSSVAGWGATVVRAPIGVEGDGGYLSSSANASAVLSRVTAVVDAAISAGVYVIVDWHYSSNAVYQSQATTVFQQLAQRYASSPNVIWEPFNEPTSNSWSSLKTYHEAIIRTIRAAGSQNLVVVGTPTWSQDVDVASQSPVVDSAGNTAYTLHFYAGTHGQSLRDKANAAMGRGVAVFVTEWGTVDASGNGGYNATESSNWTSWMDSNKISSANWSLNDKAESASALVGGASATGPWADGALTQSGLYVKAYIGKGSGGGGGTTYALTVAKSGTGSGTVTSSAGGISCGSTCSASFTSGVNVTLTATAASGSTFAGWSGSCSGTGACAVTMSTARSVTATFNSSGGGGGGTTPCASPVTFTGNTGNFNTTGAVCFRTSQAVNGWGCSNLTGRTVRINNGTATTTCGGGPFPLAKTSDGYTYFAVSAGTYAWASIYVW
jgi:endoglucanase